MTFSGWRWAYRRSYPDTHSADVKVRVISELLYQPCCVETQTGGPDGGVSRQDQGGARDGEGPAMFVQWCGNEFVKLFVKRHQFPGPGEQLRVAASAGYFVNF